MLKKRLIPQLLINTFINFWNETMIEDEFETELEIEEIIESKF